jgi:glycosyltransferase involved in cell wall biosynthesis
MKFESKGKQILHIVPGDGPNPLIQEIALFDKMNTKILAIYDSDKTLPLFCEKNELEFKSLGFNEKNIIQQAWQLHKYLKSVRPLLVYAHSFYPSIIVSIIKVFHSQTVLIPVRHHNKVHILSRNLKAIVLDRWISKICRHTVAVSDSVKETLISEGCRSNKITVIYNGIRSQVNGYSEVSRSLTSNRYRLIALGRIDWQKNYETMIIVARELKKQYLHFEIRILGSGPDLYLNDLKLFAKQNGVEDVLFWEGRQKDIYSYLVNSDLFIHSALDEACPLVLLETMSFGIPVVSSSGGGSRDLLNGFYQGIEATDFKAFTDLISHTLINLEAKRVYAREIAPLVAQKFSPELMARGYFELAKLFLPSNKV